MLSFVPFLACWPLSSSLCSPGCECCPSFISPVACWPLLLCLCSLGCECCPLFILFTTCWPFSCAVSACQRVSSTPWQALIPPIQCLLTSLVSLLASMWVLPLICPAYCLLIPLALFCWPACECHPHVCCFLPADLSPTLCALSVCEHYSLFVLTATFTFWCCFLSISTCNFQEQTVSLLKSFVETVGSPFLFPTIFKPFQDKFSSCYHNIHQIMIGIFFILFCQGYFLIFSQLQLSFWNMLPFCFPLATHRHLLCIKLSCNISNLDCPVLQLNFLQLFKTIQMQSSYSSS